MENTFTFSLDLHDSGKDFEGTFERRGYSYRIGVTVEDSVIWYEPDEERNFRAILEADTAGKKKVDKALVEAIAIKLEALFRE